MSKKTVFSGVGHGGLDGGAISNGLKESDINLIMALACNEVLTSHGIPNPMSRYKDENDPLEEEIREANASGAFIAIDFHNNAGGGDGFEAYHSIGDAAGKKLAHCIEKHVVALGQNSRGVKTKAGAGGKDYFGFIRETNMTAIIVESFFLDSDDRFIADTIEEQRSFGVAIAKGILEYLGIEYKGEGSTTPIPGPTPVLPQTRKLDVFYKAWTAEDGWLPEVKNLTDYAGVFGHAIRGLMIRLSSGDVDYKVSTLRSNGYYPTVRNHEDYAGDLKNNVDKVQILNNKLKYRVRLLNGRWLPWVIGDSDFAGLEGYSIDAIEIDSI